MMMVTISTKDLWLSVEGIILFLLKWNTGKWGGYVLFYFIFLGTFGCIFMFQNVWNPKEQSNSNMYLFCVYACRTLDSDKHDNPRTELVGSSFFLPNCLYFKCKKTWLDLGFSNFRILGSICRKYYWNAKVLS